MARQSMSLEVKAYWESHPTASTGDAARALHTSRKTAAKYRPANQETALPLQTVSGLESNVQSFNFEGNGIRAFISSDGTIWFLAKDLCDLFGTKTSHLREILDSDELGYLNVSSSMDVVTNGGIKPIVISEPGLYRYANVSRKPFAKRFSHWVNHVVLPSIRKHGAYITPDTTEKIISDPEFGIRLLTALKNEQDKRRAAETKVRKLQPAARFSEQMQKRHGTITVGESAAQLSSNGYPITEVKLFQFFRDSHLLSRQKGSRWNIPTKKALSTHYLIDSIKSYEFPKGSGKYRYYHQPLVTPSGMQRLLNQFCPPILPSFE